MLPAASRRSEGTEVGPCAGKGELSLLVLLSDGTCAPLAQLAEQWTPPPKQQLPDWLNPQSNNSIDLYKQAAYNSKYANTSRIQATA